MLKKVTSKELIAGMEYGKEIKRKAKEKKIPIWWLARIYGINDGNMSRLLRDLSEEDYKRLNNVIDTLAAEQKDGDADGN